ncbi:indolepyruvate ferredoxin oxidoreductase family protein [Kibdelosporangium phytohabitans]|uniref:2-oxoacid ferredoxin oxidoreductase n=1 Tax=Kibdelosporangium phytohabitans TaxID=860235 RepID=A0A0N9I1D4_9PSEU|nr:indolepyruvate ferredoxin oxidoreductase family protein [Kibdelosporangium phytohabitans]ALG11370.1 2-oxoacid ferredoxin oxidoreductase [Kibdelosporangium phytohabitans]MBE1462694.1 indolepyruvate ferredoxin oxidoreductase [Kibdelosporangium phytohabitans]
MTFTLEDRYVRETGPAYLTGIQALVRVLLDRIRHDRRAGLTTNAFVSGYSGSPLGGFDLELGRRRKLLDEYGIVHQPGLNEELGATAVMGSQLAAGVGTQRPDGVVGMWYGKAPGLDRATDALRHANLAGTDPRGGAVALVGDDPNAKSSTVPNASELALADLAIPVFFPSDSQDLLEHGLHAVEMSRATGLWTSIKVVANVADAAGTVALHDDWKAPALPERAYKHIPSARLLGQQLAALERSLFDTRIPLSMEYARASGLNRIVERGDGDIGVITAGKSYLDVQQALHALGLAGRVRVLKLGVIHPVDPVIVREFAAGLSDIVVVEEKRAFIETAVKNILYGTPSAPRVHGKQDNEGRTLLPQSGELSPEQIAGAFARRLPSHESVQAWQRRRKRERISVPLLARTPYFCSGCPHNSSTKVPEGTLVGAGIGCHTMALFMEPEQVGNVLGVSQMGGEGMMWLGMSPFVESSHLVQNIGDGTFMHSGSLAVRAAVAAGSNITFKLLHNSTVAMTGGQQAVGALPIEKIASMMLVEGVRKIVITSDEPERVRKLRLPGGVEVRHRDEMLSSQGELARIPGVTMLIHDQECAAEKRRKRRRGKVETPAAKVMINERVCEGCGDCGAKSNCLSVQPHLTEFGRKTQIHQSSCNVDYACLSGDCPSFLSVVPGKKPEHRTLPDIAADDLPDPVVQGDDFTVRITGIGGTGVVTVSQILGTAAAIDGKHVRTLDQIGLAQKGGAVVSDVKVTKDLVEQAAKLASGEADLYLACDALVGADPAHLAAADTDRTTAVVSTTQVPTARMVVDTGVSYPDSGDVRSVIDAAARRTVYLDAQGLAEALFDDAQYANILQVGAAFQTGAITLSAEAVEQAIRLNGTAVDKNLQAFRRGRQAVADPDAIETLLTVPVVEAPLHPSTDRIAGIVAAAPATELVRVVRLCVSDLIAYQNERYAGEYATFVEQVRSSSTEEIAEAVARNLYKLMAYKDEYEVARLSLDLSAVEAQFGVGAKVSYRLHPPVLRAMGMKRKLSLGRWFRPVFRLLAAMRKLRGTKLDLFGYAHVRKVERALISEYREAVRQAIGGDPATALELAQLPDMVRGYEQIKLDNVTAYRDRMRDLLAPAPVENPVGTAA